MTLGSSLSTGLIQDCCIMSPPESGLVRVGVAGTGGHQHEAFTPWTQFHPPTTHAPASCPTPPPSSASGLGFGIWTKPAAAWDPVSKGAQTAPTMSPQSESCSLLCTPRSFNDLGLSFPNCTMKGWIECSAGASPSGGPGISDSGQEGLAEIFVRNGTSPSLMVSLWEMRKENRPRHDSDP